jgi:hypothetical protein
MNININEIDNLLYGEKIRSSENICMFAGQISSGKSKFINNIIGFNWLPTATYETTSTPTYIKKGENIIQAVINGERIIFSADDIKKMRKGDIEPEKIYISSNNITIPKNITFVDMPGINSTDECNNRQFEKMLEKASAVFYFLGKRITFFDIAFLEKIEKQFVKLIIIRTKIDVINISEESVESVINDERAMLKNICPSADVYFVSLERKLIESEFDELQNYISHNLLDELETINKQNNNIMIRDKLIFIRDNLLSENSDTKENFKKFEINNKKKIRKIRKRLDNMENTVFIGINTAKINYLNLGRMYIKNNLSDGITKINIHCFIKKLLNDLNKWYILELEDILKGITDEEEIKAYNETDIISLSDIDKILDCADRTNISLFMYGYYYNYAEKTDDIFKDENQAFKYYTKIINKIFNVISSDFHNKYYQFLENVISEYKKILDKEKNLIISFIDTDKKELLIKIENYLEAIDNI